MKLDLMPLQFTRAIDIINWCQEHDIDGDKCIQLKSAMKTAGGHDCMDWTLEIPDRYMTWFSVQWDL